MSQVKIMNNQSLNASIFILHFSNLIKNGWVKPDFAKGSQGNTFSIKKQSKMYLNDCARMKQSTETIECTSTPANSSELVVQKKKVTEVKHWLEQAFSNGNQVKQFSHILCIYFL